MDRLEPEVLKIIADALFETIQCPVCLASLRPPVTQCSSGHGICPDCQPNLNNTCPTCREPFIATTPVILHQLLEALPRACQFKTLGCNKIYLPGGTHEKICSYRTVDCKLIECDWEGQCRKLQSHLLDCHEDPTVSLQGDMKAEMTWRQFHSEGDVFKYIPFIAYDQIFWTYIHVNSVINKLCISFTMVSNGESDSEYYAVINFRNGDFAYTYTMKIPLDTTFALMDLFDEVCMTVPTNMLCKFMDSESTLKYNVHIIKENN